MSGTTDAGRLLVRIEATTAQLRQQLQAAEQQVAGTAAKIDTQLKQADKAFSRLEDASKAAQQAVAGLAGKLGPMGGVLSALGTGGAAAAAGIAVLGAGLLQAAKAGDEATATLAKLSSSTGSLAQATQIYEGLFRLSQQTGIAVAESAGSFSRFAVAAKEIGGTNAQVLQLVAGIQKAGIVAGASAAETGAAVQQLGQALASGALQGDELRSLLENMPQLAQKLAQELGVGLGQLRQMGSEGKLTAETVFPALLRASEKMSAEFEKMPLTMSRAKDILIASSQDFGERLDRIAGLSQIFAKFMKEGASALNNVGRAIAPTEREAAESAIIAANRRVREEQAAFATFAERAGRASASGRGGVLLDATLPDELAKRQAALDAAIAQEVEAKRRLGALLEREGERIQSDEELAARRAREAAQTAATLRLKDTAADLDARYKARLKYQETIKKLDEDEAKGGTLPSGVTFAQLRTAAAKDLADALKKASEEEAKGGEEARKAAEKRQDVIEKLNEQIKAAQGAASAVRAGSAASKEMALSLEVENKLREAGIPAIEKRTEAERKAAQQIDASVRKLDGLKEAAKKADEEAKKLKDWQEKSWNELAGIGERAFERLGDAIVQAFVNGNGAAINFGNIARGILSSVAADVAKLAFVNPIMNSLFPSTSPRATLAGALGGGGGGVGLGDLLGLSSLIPKDGLLGSLGITGSGGLLSTPLWAGPAVAIEPSIAMGVGGYMAPSSVTLGGLLGGAGAGFGAGMLLNNLIGGNQTGGMVGSGLGGLAGAAIGSLIPGIGTLIGGLIGGAAGGGLGGLFGPGESVRGYGFRLQSAGYGPDGAPTNGMASSLLPVDRTFYNDSGAQMFQAADQLVAATNAYLAARGLTVGGVSVVGGNKNGADYSSADAGNLNEAFQRLRFGAANDNTLAGALGGKTFSDLGGLQQFVEGFAAVRDTIKALTETPAQALARQLEAIGKQFDDLSAKAKEYGLSEEGLAEARQKALDAVKGQENREGQAIRAYLDRLSTNDPTAAPTDRFAAAQGIFGADLAAAQAGDASALARITSSADTLLGAGRAAYASGPQFAALRSMVVSSLENLPAMRGLPASQQPIDMVPLIDELAALKMQVADLREELRTARLKAAA
jgi:tape measure domain-containing protein